MSIHDCNNEIKNKINNKIQNSHALKGYGKQYNFHTRAVFIRHGRCNVKSACKFVGQI